MSEEEDGLRRLAREAMQSGKLPDRRPDRLWGGHGNGKGNCYLCGKPLNMEDITFDLEYKRGADDMDPTCYSVHLRCFNAWDIEREQQLRGRHVNQRHIFSDRNRASLPERGEGGTIPASESAIHSGNGSVQPKDPG
jgi:hypothetical protein